MADFRSFLAEGTIPEQKALIRNFVQGVEVMGEEATLTYTIPMPSDGVTNEGTPVLDFVQSGPPAAPTPDAARQRSRTGFPWSHRTVKSVLRY